MFREMRRGKQQLSQADTDLVLQRGTNGILACIGDEDYPYGVPLSFVYHKGKIYFHSAKAGHKIDALKKNPKVSLAVVDEDTIVSAEYTSYFRSVIAFGTVRFTEGEEWMDGFRALVEKYSGDQPDDAKHKEITGCTQSEIIAIDLEHVTGKEAIEYVKAKKEAAKDKAESKL
jgi:nitroimidazol reductase NimA-like FMN-containing flavoprotein (pyridoxamine 5'-phosphate oxidase superfamily)